MKLWEVLDRFDDRILKHRFYPFCKVVTFAWGKDPSDVGWLRDSRGTILDIFPELKGITPEEIDEALDDVRGKRSQKD